MYRSSILFVGLALFTVLSSGCTSTGRRSFWGHGSRLKPCDCGPAPRSDTPLVPRSQDPLPSGPITTEPPPSFPPNNDPPRAREGLLPSDRWEPSRSPEARILPPEELEDRKGRSSLLPPEERPRGQSPDQRPDPVEKEVPKVDEQTYQDLPVDIPAFTRVKKDVATGQKPFPEGLTWLKDKGYRTVVHLMAPEDDDSTSRRQFELRGFKYVSIKVSPQTLTRRIVDDFNHLISDATNHPVFVFDDDSSLAGALWYLHFRIVHQFNDTKAREEAARLGFKQDQAGPHRDMWLAIQRYLEKQNED